MLSIKDKGILLQIIKRSERIINKVKKMNFEEFELDEDVKEIICFNLFQIGEATKSLSKYFISVYNLIPWKLIAGMRDRIVHGYDTVNLDIVWNTATESVPELRNYCNKIIFENK